MKKILTTLAIAISCSAAFAQDIHFSQFYENAIMRNPGLTGIFSGDYKANVNIRNQWSNLSVPFVTAMASAESRVLVNKETGDYLSFGISASYDKAGSINFNSMQIYPAVNFNKSLEDEHMSYLSVGFAGGFIQRTMDMSKISTSSQWVNGGYDATASTGETTPFRSIKQYDLSTGISFNSSLGDARKINYYFGAAAFHLLKPKESFNEEESYLRLNTRWVGTLGFQAKLDDHYTVAMHFNYQNQYPHQELIGGGLVGYRYYDLLKQRSITMYMGCFYRYGDAIIPTIKFDYSDLSFTMSYDVNNSRLKVASQGVGGFEISLTARGRYKKGYDVSAQQRCPHFEEMLAPF